MTGQRAGLQPLKTNQDSRIEPTLSHHMKWQIVLGIILLILLTVSIGWHRINAWEGSLGSPTALGQVVVDALNRGDIDGLHRLRVKRDEYLSWIWPAFPASRAPYNFTPDFAWSNLNKKCLLGTSS